MQKNIMVIILAVLLGLSIYHICITDTRKNPDGEYTLKEYENAVALYHNNKIIEIYDTVDVSALPELDRISLKKGIKLSSSEEATQYIEDFDG